MTQILPPPPPANPPPPDVPQPTPEARSRADVAGAAWRSTRAAFTAPSSSPAAQAVTWTLGLLAALGLWLVLFGLVLSGLVYSHAQSGLYADFRKQLGAGVAPLGGAIARGAPVAMISSGRADLHSVVVVEGSSSGDLRDGPGHLPGTPLPGQAGASLILGRSTSFGAPFGHLTELRKDDVLKVTTGEGVFTYVVLDVRRPGDPLPAPLSTGGSQLTLVTAEGGGWRSGWAPSHAVYVDALLKGSAAAAPAQLGLPATSDRVLENDTSGMFPLVLWLQLLLVAAIGGVWVRARWGAPRAWLVALPIALSGLWGASQEVWLLLPNLF